MHVRCGYVAWFEGVLGKEIEMIDPNWGGSIISAFHFWWWAGGSSSAKLLPSDFLVSRSQSKKEAFGHKKNYLGLKYLSSPSTIVGYERTVGKFVGCSIKLQLGAKYCCFITAPDIITVLWSNSGRVNIGPVEVTLKPYVRTTKLKMDTMLAIIDRFPGKWILVGWCWVVDVSDSVSSWFGERSTWCRCFKGCSVTFILANWNDGRTVLMIWVARMNFNQDFRAP
jgi:hypothetical protein